MIREYASGRTPNPDVICNSEIKFGIFLEKAISMGADFIATGHYARVKNEDSRFWIHEAKDRNKDQTYFLWRLTQDQLSRALFPIGDYLKSEVREIAKKTGLITADKNWAGIRSHSTLPRQIKKKIRLSSPKALRIQFYIKKKFSYLARICRTIFRKKFPRGFDTGRRCRRAAF